MKPSDFSDKDPWSSVFKNSDHERIARNIMIILKKTGDQWRKLSWVEYAEQRSKDGYFSMGEEAYFTLVAPYCVSAEKAMSFSPSWRK